MNFKLEKMSIKGIDSKEGIIKGFIHHLKEKNLSIYIIHSKFNLPNKWSVGIKSGGDSGTIMHSDLSFDKAKIAAYNLEKQILDENKKSNPTFKEALMAETIELARNKFDKRTEDFEVLEDDSVALLDAQGKILLVITKAQMDGLFGAAEVMLKKKNPILHTTYKEYLKREETKKKNPSGLFHEFTKQLQKKYGKEVAGWDAADGDKIVVQDKNKNSLGYITKQEAEPLWTKAFSEAGKAQEAQMANPADWQAQSIHFAKAGNKPWTVAEAKAWLKDYGYKYGDVDEKENYINFRQADPKHFKEKSFRNPEKVTVQPFASYEGIRVTWGKLNY